MEIKPLIPVGTNIKIEKSKIENIIPNKLLDQLPQIISGEVIDYKMTDGMGIGYVINTDNNKKIWIFNNELNEQTKREYKIEDNFNEESIKTTQLILQLKKVKYDINGNRSIKTMLNPINIVSWFIFSIKDIF